MQRLLLLSVCLFLLPAFADTPVTADLWQQHCATCHGDSGQGSNIAPDLTNNTWQYGNSEEEIYQSIAHGRTGVMPALGQALGDEGITQVLGYIKSLSATSHKNQPLSETLWTGQQQYEIFCASCHGSKGTGTEALGAPDLTDDVWLHGEDETSIRDVIINGRSAHMPAHKDLLSDTEIRLLTKHVIQLNKGNN